MIRCRKRSVCLVVVALICFVLLSSLHLESKLPSSKDTETSIEQLPEQLPEIEQFQREESEIAGISFEQKRVVWRNISNFIPLEVIQERELHGKDPIPQSYRGAFVNLVHDRNLTARKHSKEDGVLDKSVLPLVTRSTHKSEILKWRRTEDQVLVQNNAKNILWLRHSQENLPGAEVDIPQEISKTGEDRNARSVASSKLRTFDLCHPLPPKLFTFYAEKDEFCLREDTTRYFLRRGPLTCLSEGTDIAATSRKSNQECVCKSGWHGQECSMPEVVFSGGYPYHYGVAIRDAPRRIIYAMPVNHEFDLVEAKVNELGSDVDVFLLLESNYTAAGQPKRLLLLEKLRSGFLEQFHQKIVYLQLTYFPVKGRVDGWAADALLRNYIGEVALDAVLQGVRDDDVIIMHDADELPVREALLFLKLHDGYPEPFGFIMKHRVFGFFWRSKEDVSDIYGGATIQFLRFILNNQTYFLRNPNRIIGADSDLAGRYRHDHRGRIHSWSFGSELVPAGWHCSWCLGPQGVQYKLLSAHVSDSPRWGSEKEKTDIRYIKELIASGHWFDNKTVYSPADQSLDGASFAPRYLLRNYDRFKHLLDKNSAVIHSSGH